MDTDTDLEIVDDDEIKEINPDFILLSATSNGNPSSEATKRRLKYLDRYRLLQPPQSERTHKERAGVRGLVSSPAVATYA
jgi:hypothetical protein